MLIFKSYPDTYYSLSFSVTAILCNLFLAQSFLNVFSLKFEWFVKLLFYLLTLYEQECLLTRTSHHGVTGILIISLECQFRASVQKSSLRLLLEVLSRSSTCHVNNSGGGIQMDRALGAKFFKFGMVAGMGIRVSKTIANKLWSISGGHLA